jgi:putative transposase
VAQHRLPHRPLGAFGSWLDHLGCEGHEPGRVPPDRRGLGSPGGDGARLAAPPRRTCCGGAVRKLASRQHTDPFGRRVRISRQTIDRWIRDWRAGGFDALVPNPRQCTPRTPAGVLELAVALRRDNPERTAAAIARILRTQLGWAPDERTLQRNFHRLGLTTSAVAGSAPVFGRFEAEHPNDLWTGDALHGIRVSVRKTHLFAFLDDHSRLLPGYRWGYAEDTVRLAARSHACSSANPPCGGG